MVFCTLANSSLRSTPLLTKMQVSRSPMARATSTAATRGIHAAAQSADGVAVADLRAHALHGGLDEVLRRPVGLCAADAEHEVAQQLHPMRVCATSG